MPSKAGKKNKIITLIILCFITGTLEAIAIILINYPLSIEMVFKFIASGFFDHAAFTEDHMVFWGIFFHYLIATIFSIALWAIYPKFKKGIKNKFLLGVIFGLMVWVVMTFAVLPITDAKAPENIANDKVTMLKNVIALILCVGLPAAIISDRYYLRKAHRAAKRRVRNHYN